MPPSSSGLESLFIQLHMAQPYPRLTGVCGKHAISGFLVLQLPKTVGSLRILSLIQLLRAGINFNPGPYTCSCCNPKSLRIQVRVWCQVCGWIHFNVAVLKSSEHNRCFYCPSCTESYILPLPMTNNTSRTRQPVTDPLQKILPTQ